MGGSCLISGCPHSEREDVCDTVHIKVDRVLEVIFLVQFLAVIMLHYQRVLT